MTSPIVRETEDDPAVRGMQVHGPIDHEKRAEREFPVDPRPSGRAFSERGTPVLEKSALVLSLRSGLALSSLVLMLAQGCGSGGDGGSSGSAGTSGGAGTTGAAGTVGAAGTIGTGGSGGTPGTAGTTGGSTSGGGKGGAGGIAGTGGNAGNGGN